MALIKNTLCTITANSLQALANLLIVILLARPLGTAEFGRLLLAVSFTAMFAIIVEFGFKWYAAKEVSQHPQAASAVAAAIVEAQVLLALGATLLAVPVTLFLGFPLRTMAVIALVWISAVLAAFTQVSRAVLRGLDLFASDAALNLILAVVMAMALLLSILLGPTALLCAAAILLARAAWFAAGRGLLRRRIGRAAIRFAPGSGAQLLAATTAYGAQIVIFRLLLEWNTIILHRFGGNAGVGEYQAVFRVVLATMLVSDVLLQAFFPLLARLAASDRPEFGRVAASLSRFLLASGAFIAGGLFIFAREVVAAGFGPAFAAAVPLLRILSLAVVAYSLSAAPTIVLIALGRQGTRARASGAVLVVHVAASFVLVPAWGGRGAAWGMVGAFALYAVVNSLVVRRSLSRFLFDRRAPRVALAAAVGIAAAWRLRAFSLLTGIAGYAALGVLLFIAATGSRERGELRRALQRSGPGPEIEP